MIWWVNNSEHARDSVVTLRRLGLSYHSCRLNIIAVLLSSCCAQLVRPPDKLDFNFQTFQCDDEICNERRRRSPLVDSEGDHHRLIHLCTKYMLCQHGHAIRSNFASRATLVLCWPSVKFPGCYELWHRHPVRPAGLRRA
jgi:hypothetical protein